MRAADGTFYTLRGPHGAPVVALIHGLGLNQDLWQPIADTFAPQFRVLTYDLHGHGQTPHPGPAPSLRTLARQLSDLLDHIGAPRAAIVGFSLGGMIARRFAQDDPARTRALAVLHSPHRRSAQAQDAILARVAQAQGQGPAATVEDALRRWFTDDFRTAQPALMNRVRAWVLANDPAIYPLYYAVFASGVEEVIAPQPALRCPTLVITGDQDYGNDPQMARAIAADIPGAQVHILPGLRHMALTQAPDETLAALLPFLRRTCLP